MAPEKLSSALNLGNEFFQNLCFKSDTYRTMYTFIRKTSVMKESIQNNHSLKRILGT